MGSEAAGRFLQRHGGHALAEGEAAAALRGGQRKNCRISVYSHDNDKNNTMIMLMIVIIMMMKTRQIIPASGSGHRAGSLRRERQPRRGRGLHGLHRDRLREDHRRARTFRGRPMGLPPAPGAGGVAGRGGHDGAGDGDGRGSHGAVGAVFGWAAVGRLVLRHRQSAPDSRRVRVAYLRPDHRNVGTGLAFATLTELTCFRTFRPDHKQGRGYLFLQIIVR